jgi:hypothetical protein
MNDNAPAGVADGCDRLIRVLTNDSDPEGDPISIESVTQPADGVTTIVSTSAGDFVRYDNDFDGFGHTAEQDTFMYTITDGTDTDTAEVTVNVAAATVDNDSDEISDECDAFARIGDASSDLLLPAVLDFNGAATSPDWAGFTGIMTNSIESSLTQRTTAARDGSGHFVVSDASEGDAIREENQQENAFQLNIATSDGSDLLLMDGFIVHGRVCAPFPTEQFASVGIFFGTGDQDNYIKAVVDVNGSAVSSVHDVREVNGDGRGIAMKADSAIGLLADGECVDLRLTVSSDLKYTPTYSLDGVNYDGFGGNAALRTVPQSWLDGTWPYGSFEVAPHALAVGIIATSQGPSAPFVATWDLVEVTALP